MKLALKRKRLLDFIEDKDMYTFEADSYKYTFEYDTEEELEKYLENTILKHEKVLQMRNKFKNVNEALDSAEAIPTNKLTFAELEIKFLAAKKKSDKVGASTYKAWASTFSKLKKFFHTIRIADLEIEDYEKFREFLADEYNLKNKTINNHIGYVSYFLTFAVTRKLIKENNVTGIETLVEEPVDKENFTHEDIQNILAFDYPQEYRDIFNIGAYSGMRVSEIVNLKNENIKEENGIYYFDITKSKTAAGVRQVPIHSMILDRVLEIDFPILKNKNVSAADKAILRQLYKVIDKKSTKSFHTFRANFIAECINNFPEKLLIIQEIVGHSKSKGETITIDTYGKGFNLNLKQEIVNSVTYQQ